MKKNTKNIFKELTGQRRLMISTTKDNTIITSIVYLVTLSDHLGHRIAASVTSVLKDSTIIVLGLATALVKGTRRILSINYSLCLFNQLYL